MKWTFWALLVNDIVACDICQQKIIYFGPCKYAVQLSMMISPPAPSKCREMCSYVFRQNRISLMEMIHNIQPTLNHVIHGPNKLCFNKLLTWLGGWGWWVTVVLSNIVSLRGTQVLLPLPCCYWYSPLQPYWCWIIFTEKIAFWCCSFYQNKHEKPKLVLN